MGINFNTVLNHVYRIDLNATFTSNAFIGTTSPDPLLTWGIAAQNAYATPLTQSYVSTLVAETGSPTIQLPWSLQFKASSTGNTDVFAFLYDTNVAASGGWNVPASQAFITDFGVQ